MLVPNILGYFLLIAHRVENMLSHRARPGLLALHFELLEELLLGILDLRLDVWILVEERTQDLVEVPLHLLDVGSLFHALCLFGVDCSVLDPPGLLPHALRFITCGFRVQTVRGAMFPENRVAAFFWPEGGFGLGLRALALETRFDV